jgi:putative membrane protein
VAADHSQAEDATRRTRLANERTYLAWWRTGLAALALGIGAGKIAPSLAGGSAWPYVLVGVSYSVIGVAFMVYGRRRLREVDEALRRSTYAAPSDRAMTILTAVGVLLGAATVALVVWQP